MYADKLCGSILLALLSDITHDAVLKARQDVDATQYFGSLYCYGDGIYGLPIQYVDEVAMVGVATPPDATVATNVTFDDSESATTLTVTANETDSLAATTFFIDSSTGANQAAGFVSTSNDSADALTTDGFMLYGNQLVWLSGNGELEQHWWARPSDTDGVYTLTWNTDASTDGGAVPVNVKNVAPVIVGGDI